MDDIIRKAAYDPRTGYVGMQQLQRTLRAEGHNVTQEQIKEVLQRQKYYQLHKRPPPMPKVRRQIIVGSAFQRVQADLIDFSNFKSPQNKQTSWLLTVIDLWTKYAWVVPLTNKTGETVANAMANVIKEVKRMGYRIQTMQSDPGSEFIAAPMRQLLQSHDINQTFSLPGRSESQGAVERFNGTLVNMIKRYMTANNTRAYIGVLPALIDNYRHNYHRAIGMSPAEAILPENQEAVATNLLAYYNHDPTQPRARDLDVGDTVRVRLYSDKKAVFKKGSDPQWSNDTYTVKSVQLEGKVWVYRLHDVRNTFYREQLQKVADAEDAPQQQQERGTRGGRAGSSTQHATQTEGGGMTLRNRRITGGPAGGNVPVVTGDGRTATQIRSDTAGSQIQSASNRRSARAQPVDYAALHRGDR